MTTRNTAYRILERAEDLVDGAYDRLRSLLGLSDPPRILPMKGFGEPAKVRVLARVLEDRGGPDGGRWRRAFRRWATREMAGLRVDVRWRDRRWQAVSDDEGYIDISVPAPDRTDEGWHTLQLEVAEDGYPSVSAEARVLVVGPAHDFGVISDIDDTVIDTGATNALSLLKSFIYQLPAEKEPFPGIDELYRALRRGPGGTSANPLFYVSSSPMNLYEHLAALFESSGIPEGPLMLRDWGFSREGLSPDGGHEHKVDKVRAIMEQTGRLPFVLIGDSGQHDPELYRKICEEHAGRVTAIAIRDVTAPERDREVAEIGRAIEAMGVPFCAAETTADLARFFAERGLVQRDAVAEVRRAA